jgi:surface protein
MSDVFEINDVPEITDIPEITDGNIRYLVRMYLKNKTKLLEPFQIIGNWNVSKVKNMSNLFNKELNEDLEHENLNGLMKWKVSNVENMSGMFTGRSKFNVPLECWGPHLANVKDMSTMFANCIQFNQPLKDWGPYLVNVKDMSFMFTGCDQFNQPLDNWNVSNVENMSNMFEDCKNFNQSLETWGPHLTNVNDMSYMFGGCIHFNQPLNAWGQYLGKVREMPGMFYNCETFNQPLETWGPYLGNVVEMSGMFEGCKHFNRPLISWNISRSTKRLNMFKDCKELDEGNKPKPEKRGLEITANTILENPKSTKKTKKYIELHQYVINIMNNYKENSPVSNWSGETRIRNTLIEYYSKKYSESCLTFLPIFYNSKNDLSTENQDNIKTCVDEIAHCIKVKGKNISIAIYFRMFLIDGGGHANLLIFKPNKNTLEWFEPHGAFYNLEKENKINKNNEMFISYFIQCLQENETIRNGEKINLVKPEDICPCPDFGFQAIEQQSTLPKLTTGYCSLWSLLMMKLALKFQHKTSKEIREKILEIYHDKDDLRKLMYGFSNEISNILLKHFSVTLNEYIENDELNLRFEDKHTSASSQYLSSHKTSSQRSGSKKIYRRLKPPKASSRRSRSK